VRHVLVLAACALALLAAAVPDSELESRIRARLENSKISSNGFQVRVKNGTAILTGKAEVMQHKGVATRLAKAAGAVKVDNRIQVSEAARARASATLARAREQAKIAKRTQPRSEPRSAPRSQAASASVAAAPAAPPPATAPPPVRRAVVKH
jgi:hypothetical protein